MGVVCPLAAFGGSIIPGIRLSAIRAGNYVESIKMVHTLQTGIHNHQDIT